MITAQMSRRSALAGAAGLALGPRPLAAAPSPDLGRTYYMFVFSNPAPGREAEFNRYYDAVHIPEVLAVPGFVSAERMVYNEEVQLQASALKKPKYLAFYTIVTDSIEGVVAANKRRLAAGEITPSDAFDRQSALNYLYRGLGEVVHGHTPPPPESRPGEVHTFYQIVFGEAKPGREAEFNSWYETVHDPQLANSPGWVLAERGVLSPVQYRDTPEATKYVAIFSAVTSDMAAAIAARTRDPRGPPASSDQTRTFGYTYRSLGPPVFAKA